MLAFPLGVRATSSITPVATPRNKLRAAIVTYRDKNSLHEFSRISTKAYFMLDFRPSVHYRQITSTRSIPNTTGELFVRDYGKCSIASNNEIERDKRAEVDKEREKVLAHFLVIL